MRPKKHIHTKQQKRLYDRTEDKFTFNISYQTHTKQTPRTLAIAEAFGIGIDQTQKFKIIDTQLKITPKDIVYITGDSGAGKSILLKAIHNDLGEQAIDLTEITTDPNQPIIETIGKTLQQSIELLSKVGLNDAFLFLCTYNQLSDGQKYRYKIAKLIESQKQWWLIDEFTSCLDRDTAKIIAYNLQKIARQNGKALITATTQNDLAEDLKPNILIHKRFGQEINITYYPNPTPTECSITKQMNIEPGTKNDWNKLSTFHYRAHTISVPRKIYRMVRGEELCGVIVYTYPPLTCYGRRFMLSKMTLKQTNQQLSTINRIVIPPKYRTIGLGKKIIHDTLPLVGTPHVELIAVMAKYSPFAEKAGMQKVTQQQNIEGTTKLTNTLKQLNFDLQLIASQQYVEQKIANLTTEQIKQLKTAFKANKHPSFKKQAPPSSHNPYGKTTNYLTYITSANNNQISRLIKTLAMLNQTKVYLFWNKQNQNKKPTTTTTDR